MVESGSALSCVKLEKVKQELDALKNGMKTVYLKIFCQLKFDEQNPQSKEICDDMRKYTTIVDYYIKTVEEDVLLKITKLTLNHKKALNKLRHTTEENKALKDEIELLKAKELKYSQEIKYYENKNCNGLFSNQEIHHALVDKSNGGFLGSHEEHEISDSKDAWHYDYSVNTGYHMDEDSTFSFQDLAAETSDEDEEYEAMKVECSDNGQEIAKEDDEVACVGDGDSSETEYVIDEKAEKRFQDENGELDLKAIALATCDFIKENHITKKRFAEEILKTSFDCFNKLMYRSIHSLVQKRKASTMCIFKKMKNFLLYDSAKKREILADPHLDTKEIFTRLKKFLDERNMSKKQFARTFLPISGEYFEVITQRQLEYHKCRNRTKGLFQRIKQILDKEMGPAT